jgi:hypothetical protein
LRWRVSRVNHTPSMGMLSSVEVWAMTPRRGCCSIRAKQRCVFHCASQRLPIIARYFLERRTIGSADGRDRTSAFEPAETPANCGLFRHVSRHCGRVRDRSHGYCCRPDAAARSRLRRHREPESDAGGRLSSPAEERCRLEAENLFLRHQLSIALRHAPLRPRLRGSDRALLVWMTQLWREPACPDRGTSS